jgi:hypothetical protein
MSKRILEEIAVGGLSSLALVLIYILIRANLDGAGPGDWLQFAGAMLGSGTAVGGALFIEALKRRRDERQGEATLLDALSETAYAIRSAGEPLEGDLNQKIGEINARRYLLEVAQEFTDFVLKKHLLPNSEVWRRSRGFGRYIEKIMALQWFEYDPHAGEDLCSEKTVEHWHKAVKKIVEIILPIVEGEISTIKKF